MSEINRDGEGLDVVAELNPIHDDLSLLMFFESVETADERGFTGARRTKDDNHLSLLNGQADAFQNVELVEPLMHVAADNDVL